MEPRLIEAKILLFSKKKRGAPHRPTLSTVFINGPLHSWDGWREEEGEWASGEQEEGWD